MIAIAFAAVLLFALAGPGWAGFEEGIAAYKRGDYATALREFLPPADQGDAKAQIYVGMMYNDGKGVSQDHAEAVKWYRRAAEQGNPWAQQLLGRSYYDGEGVSRDYAEAAKWYDRAAEQGDSIAQFDLGEMYEAGRGVPQDLFMAVKWYRRSAEQGDLIAMWSLGRMYYLGKGVPRDYGEAWKWFYRLAERGYTRAQSQIALMWELGQNVTQSFAEAARWYRRAAEKGDEDAQLSLGAAYYDGRGVPQDYSEAGKWFRLAAEQGSELAMNYLGLMYEMGHGVPRDLVQAYAWFNLAAARDTAKEQGDMMVRNRDRVAAQLSSQQLARGQQLTRDMERNLTLQQQARIERGTDPSPGDTPSTVPGGSAPSPPGAAKGPSSGPGAAPSSSARVARIQDGLAALGYDPGPADGRLGPKTHAAIRAFQADQGLPRTGEASEDLAAALAAARQAKTRGAGQRELTKDSTGSGVIVSGEGHVLTNHHVIEGCQEVRIGPGGLTERVSSDAQSDLALLKASRKSPKSATFREGRGIRPGDTVVVVGFPLQGLLTSDVNVTTGTISALAGPGDDRRLLQMTAPVQPGNSGGPLLDLSGNVVGLVVGKLDALKVARRTGDIPQNVNFAISAGIVRAFLDAHGVPYKTGPSAASLGPADVAGQARDFTVLVECWK